MQVKESKDVVKTEESAGEDMLSQVPSGFRSEYDLCIHVERMRVQEVGNGISEYFFETEVKKHMDTAMDCISQMGMIEPTVFVYSAKWKFIMPDFDFSDRYIARQIIRAMITKTKAEMVVTITEAWIRNSFSAISKDRRQVICVYGETANQNMLIVQEFEHDKSGKIVFGISNIVRNEYSGQLTGYFRI